MVIPSRLYSRFSADKTHKIGSSSLVQFSSKVTGTNTASVYYRWDFDNDGIIDWEGIDESSPLYNYTSTGDYSVALSVSNSVGEVHSTLKVDYIQLLPSVVAEFSADVRTGGAPFSVQFTDLSENNPQFWSYDFDGDGTIDSTLQNPSHIYNSAGNYTVILTVSNNFGAENTSSDTVTKVDYIIVEPALVADFTVDKPAAAIGENVQFFDSSENSPEFWFWDFDNDGVTDSTLENPVTSFGTTGKKTVSLKVSNSWSSAEITKSKIVKIFGSSPNHYVFIGGSATSPYTSWSTAAHDIQSAITASEPFDSIYIFNGNYSSAGYIKEGTNAILIETEIELIGCGKNVKIDGSGKMRGGYVSSGKVENITFENGAVFGSATAGRGGGVFCTDDGEIDRCIFRNNSAREGGGILAKNGGTIFSSLVISNNATVAGGGVELRGGGVVYNLTITKNTATSSGGGIYCSSGGEVFNTIIFGNTAPANANCFNGGSGGTYSHSCSEPLQIGSSNISDNPLLLENFSIDVSSPCEGVGEIFEWMDGAKDLSGGDRVLGTVDIGAFEAVPEPFLIVNFYLLFIIYYLKRR